MSVVRIRSLSPMSHNLYTGCLQYTPQLHGMSQGISARISRREFHAKVCFKRLERTSRAHHAPEGKSTSPNTSTRRRNGQAQKRFEHTVQQYFGTNQRPSCTTFSVFNGENSSRTSHTCWASGRRISSRVTARTSCVVCKTVPKYRCKLSRVSQYTMEV